MKTSIAILAMAAMVVGCEIPPDSTTGIQLRQLAALERIATAQERTANYLEKIVVISSNRQEALGYRPLPYGLFLVNTNYVLLNSGAK